MRGGLLSLSLRYALFSISKPSRSRVIVPQKRYWKNKNKILSLPKEDGLLNKEWPSFQRVKIELMSERVFLPYPSLYT